MRVCVRLAVLAGLLVAVAMGLVALRTGVHQGGHRLHDLFRDKRRLEQQCCRLELRIARLRSQDRLQGQAAHLCRREDDADSTPRDPAAGARPVIDRALPGPP